MPIIKRVRVHLVVGFSFMFNQLTDPENDTRIYENDFLFQCTIFILKIRGL